MRILGCSALALHDREVAEDDGSCWLPSSRSVLNKFGDTLLDNGLQEISQICKSVRAKECLLALLVPETNPFT